MLRVTRSTSIVNRHVLFTRAVQIRSYIICTPAVGYEAHVQIHRRAARVLQRRARTIAAPVARIRGTDKGY